LKKKDLPEIHTELRKLADEHRTGRAMAAQFERSAVAYLSHRPGGNIELVQAMRQLAALYDGHIEREEHILLPLMEKNLSRKEQEWLRDKFSEIEWYIGLDVHRNYEVLAEDMKHWLTGSANQKRQAVHA
jgi:hemerythrin-like domain-containing protein